MNNTITKKLLSIVVATSIFGTSLQCMDVVHQEGSRYLGVLPQDLTRYITSLFLETKIGYNFSCFKTITVGSSVWSLACSPSGKTILAGLRDTPARLLDMETGNEVLFAGHSRPVLSVAFSPGGDKIATGSMDGTVCLYTVITKELLRKFEEHVGSVLSIAFNPGGDILATGSADGTVCLHTVVEKDLPIKLKGKKPVMSVAFNPSGDILAVGSDDGKVRLYTGITNNIKKRASTLKSEKPSYVFTGNLLKEITAVCPIKRIAFNPDGDLIAIGSYDGAVRLYNVATGDLLRELNPGLQHDPFLSVAFSPSGDIVATGSNDGIVRLWDVLTGIMLKELHGHTSSVCSAAFNPDGDMLVTGSEDGTIIFWKRSSGFGEWREKRAQAALKFATEKGLHKLMAPTAQSEPETVTEIKTRKKRKRAAQSDPEFIMEIKTRKKRTCIVQSEHGSDRKLETGKKRKRTVQPEPESDMKFETQKKRIKRTTQPKTFED